MLPLTTKSLTESLTLLFPERLKDGEGGWEEKYVKGPRLWGALWPLLDKQEKPHYRIGIRAGLSFPVQSVFLWHLRHATKRLKVITEPRLIQNNRFLCMIAREEAHA